MMKRMKKLALVLICTLVVGLLGGCSVTFDASAYIQALLDNSYKNDSTGYVKMRIGTAEEALSYYEQGLDAEVTNFATSSGIELTEEQEALYREQFAEILAGVKYTVGESVKQEDGSYVVTVTYEKMNVFGPAVESYNAIVMPLLEEWMADLMLGNETYSEDEMMNIVIVEMANCLGDSFDTVTYDEPATTTIRVEIVDGLYTANTEDFVNLELLLFDTDTETETE